MQINPKGYSQMSVANSSCIYTDVTIAVIPPPFFAYVYIYVCVNLCPCRGFDFCNRRFLL